MTTPTPPAAAPTPNYNTFELPDGVVIGMPWPHTLATWRNGSSRGATKLEYDLWKIAEQLQRELAAKDARIAALEKDRDEFHGQYRMKCDVETKTLHIELADLRAQLQAANERAEKAENERDMDLAEMRRFQSEHIRISQRLDSEQAALSNMAEVVANQKRDLAEKEQTNAALKAEVERLTGIERSYNAQRNLPPDQRTIPDDDAGRAAAMQKGVRG